MDFSLISLSSNVLQKQAVDAVIACNEYTQRFGLALTPAQAAELIETRGEALRTNGRIEFGGGVTDKIIKAFCDSPYLSMHNYTGALHALTELFYCYKNETLDLLSDDELIAFMSAAFNGKCQGSLDLLGGRELARLAENLRFGRPLDYVDEAEDEEGEDDE